jgi:hypothetical protein
MPTIEFDAKKGYEPKALAAANTFLKSNVVALNSKAVLPSGKLASRADILSQLGLNSGTPPEAWLAVIACGVNASALGFQEAEVLVSRGILDRAYLDKIRK